MKKELKFLVFADLHYHKRGYRVGVEHVEQMMDRAHESGADLVIHAGDLCENYQDSAEVLRTLLQNKYDLPVYGVMGNHELGHDIPFPYVVTFLSNRDNRVFGSVTGDPNDMATAYYYTDLDGGYRLICLDSTYSYNEQEDVWERNKKFRRREENIKEMSVGPVQRAWLAKVLDDAVEKKLTCIVVSHFGFCPTFPVHSPDYREVVDIFNNANAKRKGTVLMAINGHYHSNDISIVDNILYFNVNVVFNGFWQVERDEHYNESHVFDFTDYDENGNKLETTKFPYSKLGGARHTWFFKDPLSAVVTITADNEIRIEGAESEWVFGIAPKKEHKYIEPRISSGVFRPLEDTTQNDV